MPLEEQNHSPIGKWWHTCICLILLKIKDSLHRILSRSVSTTPGTEHDVYRMTRGKLVFVPIQMALAVTVNLVTFLKQWHVCIERHAWNLWLLSYQDVRGCLDRRHFWISNTTVFIHIYLPMKIFGISHTLEISETFLEEWHIVRNIDTLWINFP